MASEGRARCSEFAAARAAHGPRSSLSAHARSTTADEVHCLTYRGTDLVGGTLEGGLFDEFGEGEIHALAATCVGVPDTPGCLQAVDGRPPQGSEYTVRLLVSLGLG